MSVAAKRIEEAREGNHPVLDLSGLGLTEVPAEVWQLTQLQELDLFDNNLTSLPEQIGQLGQLQHLCVSCNDLTSLPPQIGQLTQLETLDLSYNKLTSLPVEIGQLSQLSQINLFGNSFKTLPLGLGRIIGIDRDDDVRLEEYPLDFQSHRDINPIRIMDEISQKREKAMKIPVVHVQTPGGESKTIKVDSPYLWRILHFHDISIVGMYDDVRDLYKVVGGYCEPYDESHISEDQPSVKMKKLTFSFDPSCKREEKVVASFFHNFPSLSNGLRGGYSTEGALFLSKAIFELIAAVDSNRPTNALIGVIETFIDNAGHMGTGTFNIAEGRIEIIPWIRDRKFLFHKEKDGWRFSADYTARPTKAHIPLATQMTGIKYTVCMVEDMQEE